jgi:hypothetical protein
LAEAFERRFVLGRTEQGSKVAKAFQNRCDLDQAIVRARIELIELPRGDSPELSGQDFLVACELTPLKMSSLARS